VGFVDDLFWQGDDGDMITRREVLMFLGAIGVIGLVVLAVCVWAFVGAYSSDQARLGQSPPPEVDLSRCIEVPAGVQSEIASSLRVGEVARRRGDETS
jgi:hypothetical protein